jgi:two-component system, NarL family, response regulator LiaR
LLNGLPTILIIDDDDDIRLTLVDYLTYCGHKVWEASDGDQALALAQTETAEIVLLDVVMPSLSGMELIPQLQMLLPGAAIILLTAYGSIPQAVEAMRLGVFNYLEKPLHLQQVQAVIEQAWKAKQALDKAFEDLTNRELEVLRLLATGKTDLEIAEALCLSVHTVNTHTRKVFLKLEVNNRTRAATAWNRYHLK